MGPPNTIRAKNRILHWGDIKIPMRMRQEQMILLFLANLPDNQPLRYFNALFSRLVLFSNCFLSAFTCLVKSLNSCLATTAA